MKDSLQRFLFDSAPARGAHVRLDDSWREILARHPYPAALRDRLGELAAAGMLLAANLKFDGQLILQVQGSGPVTLLVVEIDAANRTLRATARWQGDIPPEADLATLAGQGQCVLTLDPGNGQEPYQGIVGLEGGSVASLLTHYMQASVQLDTRLVLAAGADCAAGILIQRLPEGHGDEDGWPRVVQLTETLKAEELRQLAATDILHRLYHQEDVRVFDPEPVSFACSCSRECVGGMLKLLGREEVANIIAEQGSVEIACEFCRQSYVFDEEDAAGMFSEPAGEDDGQATRH